MPIHLTLDLNSLHRNLLSMCSMVEDMVHKALGGLANPDETYARELAEQDGEIDRWDVQIEEECLKILALHQPVAIDLRRIATVMKISGELERVADLAVHIVERACCVQPGSEVYVLDRLKEMAKLAVELLHRAIDSYVSLDSEMAREVCKQDDTVDEMNREIIEELVQAIEKSPNSVDSAMHLFSVSRHIERVADHATNIAEDVVYLVEGEIIRHRSVN